MTADLKLAASIVNHEDLSVNDLANTLLMFLATLPEKAESDTYALCRPALARVRGEDPVVFIRIARKIKEVFALPKETLIEDLKPLSAGPGYANVGIHESQADQLVALAKGMELFHDGLRDPYARIQVDGHKENWRCRSRAFRRYVAYRFFQQYGKAPSNEAQSAGLAVIEGEALFASRQYPLANRVAWHEGALWYDLSDAEWRAVRMTAQGWSIVSHPPILFRRYTHQAPQVVPVRGGTLALLDPYVNLSPDALALLKVTMCSYLIPEIPHPGLHPHGQQGAGKSSLLRAVRQLIDPSQVPLLSFPRDSTELAQQISHYYCPFFDNISVLTPWISNSLCRAVSGEGFTKRELFSDDDDVIYHFRRCIGLNGINIAATTPDLLDRLVLIEMKRIAEQSRQEEEDLWASFERDRPRILAAVFDAVVAALRLKPQVHISHLPRMADFSAWGEAIAQGLGDTAGAFLVRYKANIQVQHREVVHGHSVAAAIVDLMATQPTWEGTATELLKELVVIAERLKLDLKEKSWPKAPNYLVRRLREVDSNLLEVGIAISFDNDKGNRTLLRLEKVGKVSPVSPVSPEPNDFKDLAGGDSPAILMPTPSYPLDMAGKNGQQNQAPGDTGDTGDILQPLSGPRGVWVREGGQDLERHRNGTSATDAPPLQPCRACRRSAWWQNGTGLWVCQTCHPKPYAKAST